jgi:hypothetical protein
VDIFILKNNLVELEFNKFNGALVGIKALSTDWNVLSRPQLGLSFRLLVPMPGKRNNPVHGEKQAVDTIEVRPDGMGATFIWNSVESEFGGRHAIKVILDISLSENAVVFTPTIVNCSEYTVENVYYPYVGDLQPPEGSEWLEGFHHGYSSPSTWSIWPEYKQVNMHYMGYFSVDYPTQISSGAPMKPFILIRNKEQGLYFGANEASCELFAWHTELRPGYGSSIDFSVPKDKKIGEKDVSTRFAVVHVPYIQSGEKRTLTPISLRPFKGDWQKGADIYKEWRKGRLKTSEVPKWAMEPHSWQQIHINSPEDELRITYRELVQIGEDCARHGVKAIQLVGWNDGGQDQGNPSHDTDKRLGTYEELKEAIAKIKELGIKVILFTKFTWADQAAERFEEEYIKYSIKDPYGNYYVYSGYPYQTVTQLLNLNTKRLIPMCFLSEEYLRVCENEFKKVVDLGADGMLFDESQHHSPTLLCFDESHGHRYGAPVYANDLKLIENFSNLEGVSKDFLYAGEACYDWEYDAYHLAYHRSESKTHIPLQRYLLPDMPIMTAVTGFNDRNMINQCLMYKYIVSYEPYNFKGRLDDYPLTLEYGKKMDALRMELREYLWDGEFKDEVGASVTTSNGQKHTPYSVFVNRKNNLPCAIISNYDSKSTISVYVSFDNGTVATKYRIVGEDNWKPYTESVLIPPESAAVVV